MKRFVCLLAALALCYCLLPQGAWAAPSTVLDAINLETTTENQSGDGWTWDAASKTLALKNCDLSFHNDGFLLPAGTVVTVEGTNSILAGADHGGGTAMFVNNKSKIGASTLTVKNAGGVW